jgi:hypothetical protein
MTLATFLNGATTVGCLTIGLFFFKFWRESRDRLFLAFTLGLWLLALDYALLGIAAFDAEDRVWIFAVRLLAFALVVAGIIDKNRRPG